MIPTHEIRDYVRDRVSKMQQKTMKSAREHYKTEGSMSPDFAVQKWLEIFAQDEILRSVDVEERVAARDRQIQVEAAPAKLL